MALAITSMTFDQAVYAPGSTITLTVNYTSDDSAAGPLSSTATAVVADSVNTATGSAPFVVTDGTAVMDSTTVTASDNRAAPGTWTLVSNTASGTGPWTGVAVLTSVA